MNPAVDGGFGEVRGVKDGRACRPYSPAPCVPEAAAVPLVPAEDDGIVPELELAPDPGAKMPPVALLPGAVVPP